MEALVENPPHDGSVDSVEDGASGSTYRPAFHVGGFLACDLRCQT